MKTFFTLSLLLFFLFACQTTKQERLPLDIQGHRGARGLYPENTIEGFLRAIDMGVTTLEMDVVVSGDSQLVVSHDPKFNPLFCLDTQGHEVIDDTITLFDQISLYRIPYDSIKKFDCGSKGNYRFPQQKKMKACKPLLSEVIDTVEAYIKAKGLNPINYNIETKSEAKYDGFYNPPPAAFAKRLFDMVKSKGILPRTTIQSFDIRTLQWVHANAEPVSLALLVENTTNVDSCIKALGFTPTIYSPNFELLNKDVVDKLHTQKMKVIPWTVNEPRDMRRVEEMGVDGIISDYPDKAIKLLQKP